MEEIHRRGIEDGIEKQSCHVRRRFSRSREGILSLAVELEPAAFLMLFLFRFLLLVQHLDDFLYLFYFLLVVAYSAAVANAYDYQFVAFLCPPDRALDEFVHARDRIINVFCHWAYCLSHPYFHDYAVYRHLFRHQEIFYHLPLSPAAHGKANPFRNAA